MILADGRSTAVTYHLNVLPAHGTLSLDGVPLAVDASFTGADLSSGRVSYLPGNSAAADDTFTFTADDPQGAAIGPSVFRVTAQHTTLPMPAPGPQPSFTAVPGPAAFVPPLSVPAAPQQPSGDQPVAQAPGGHQRGDQSKFDTPTLSAPRGAGGGGAQLPVANSHAEKPAALQSAPLPATIAPALAAEADATAGSQAENGFGNLSIQNRTLGGLTRQRLRSDKGRVLELPVLESNSHLWQDLDSLHDQMTSDAPLRVWAGSASFVSMGMTVVYFMWSVRAGSLLSSLLSSMPAWKLIDPLPILDHMADSTSLLKVGEEEDKSLNALVDADRG